MANPPGRLPPPVRHHAPGVSDNPGRALRWRLLDVLVAAEPAGCEVVASPGEQCRAVAVPRFVAVRVGVADLPGFLTRELAGKPVASPGHHRGARRTVHQPFILPPVPSGSPAAVPHNRGLNDLA